jgi:hypothetical protein
VQTYNFNAATVAPSTVDTQTNDTATELIITGNSSDPNFSRDKIVIFINNYKEVIGTHSMVQGFAGGYYLHAGVYHIASGGLIAITKISSSSLTGYFSFTTYSGLSITNGTYTVGKP